VREIIAFNSKQKISSQKYSKETSVKNRPDEANRLKHVTLPLSILARTFRRMAGISLGRAGRVEEISYPSVSNNITFTIFKVFESGGLYGMSCVGYKSF
jgi:hypothetical protein